MESRPMLMAMTALTLGLAACEGSDRDDDLLADVEYTSRPTRQTVAPPPDHLEGIVATIEGRSLRLTLTHEGDHCGIRPAAALSGSSGAILFSLRLPRVVDGSACLAWVAETDVVARSVELEPGRYDVQARVEYPDGRVQYGRAGKVTVE